MFTSSEKTRCYEFKFNREKRFFHHQCENSKGIKACLTVDLNGKECIKTEDKKYRCTPILYEPKKYCDLKIVKKPNFEILENCATKSKSGRMLILFDPNDRSQCYEYFWNPSRIIYCCRGCASNRKGWPTAEIFHEDTEIEYVILSNEEHVCQMRKYNPEKYFSSNEIVISPNFEIQTNIKNGIERKTLIIFDENDRKSYYTYYFCKKDKIFYCNGCNRKQTFVSAKMRKNDENEEYVVLSNKKHVCSPRVYTPQNEIIILRPPKCKFIAANEKFSSKLFVFCSTDPTLCYTFSQHKGDKRYRCLGCILVAQQKNKNQNRNHQTKQVVTATLEKDDGPNEEYFVKINADEKHVCQPQKYEPEKYEIKILKPTIDYVLFRNKRKNGNVNLVIYHQNDKKLCYQYCYKKASKNFQCSGCSKKKSYVTAKLHQDSDGNEYINVNEKKHICTPKKYSSIIKSNTVILQKSDLDFFEPKKKEIAENRIIRRPNFELQRNSKDVPERRLIIFFNDDRKFCYDYRYDKYQFACKKCNVTAKIHNNIGNDNENFVILSETKHKCEPVKYVPEKVKKEKKEKVKSRKTITDNFGVHCNESGIPNSRLTILNDDDKSLGYRYFLNSKNSFCCIGCKSKRKYSSVKLKSDKDGNQTLQFGKTEHICIPWNLKKEKLYFADFEFEENRKTLITKDPNKKNRHYKFAYDENLRTFCCVECLKKKKKYVTATVFKENDEKEFVLLNVPHCCVTFFK